MASKFLLTLILLSNMAVSKESREIIAIIDTGINTEVIVNGKKMSTYMCNLPIVDLTGTGINDNYGHGTNVAAIIAQKMNTKKQCLFIIKWYNTGKEIPNCKMSPIGKIFDCSDRDSYIKKITFAEIFSAMDNNASYINMSLASMEFIQEEYDILKKAVSLGIKIAVASGNNGYNLSTDCNSFPACYSIKSDNYQVIGSCKNGKYEPYSNFGGPVKYCRNGTNVNAGNTELTGTSQATALFMADWIGGKVR